jgi:L-threonylcarbamoyladenylate synthase
VAAAAETVPPSLMAHTGYCAVRSPSHSTARALIAAADCPIAAPSANKFGHVSPTTAHHVWDDLSMEDVWILQDHDNDNDHDDDTTTANQQQESTSVSSPPSSCHVGVESTVAKLEMNMNSAGGIHSNTLTVLRQGAISVQDLGACLLKAGFGTNQIQVSAVQRATADHVANVAPGQTIRHYSPRVPSFLVSAELYGTTTTTTTTTTTESIQPEQEPEQNPDTHAHALQSTILIDFGQRLVHWKEHCLSYRDLSVTGDSAQACATVFEALRWTERVAGAERVLFPEFATSDQSDALTMALKDRLTRAASGVVLEKL